VDRKGKDALFYAERNGHTARGGVAMILKTVVAEALVSVENR
jgi:hypothetical protein